MSEFTLAVGGVAIVATSLITAAIIVAALTYSPLFDNNHEEDDVDV